MALPLIVSQTTHPDKAATQSQTNFDEQLFNRAAAFIWSNWDRPGSVLQRRAAK